MRCGLRKLALAAAAEFHELAERELYAARGIARKDQIAAELDRLAGLYVSARANAALIIYAWNETDVCRFLWLNSGPAQPLRDLQDEAARGDQPGLVSPLFVRMPNVRSHLHENIDALRETILSWSAGSQRGPRKRGVIVAEAPMDPAISPKQASRFVADTLFPPEIRAALARANSLTIVPVGPIATVPIAMLEPLGDGRAAIELFPINIISKLEDLKSIGFSWGTRIFRTAYPRQSHTP